MTITITPVLLTRPQILRELGDIVDNVADEGVKDLPRCARRKLNKHKPARIADFWKLYPWREMANDAELQQRGFHDVTMGFIYRGRKLGSSVSQSAGTSFLPALRQRAGCEIRTCAG
jgi:hypothetical protein